MTRRTTLAALLTLAMAPWLPSTAQAADGAEGPDWAGLRRYQADNAALPPPGRPNRRVVFMGDSITEGWSNSRASVFAGHPERINRGISGQTTPQMLLRFRQDVVALQPRAVVILAGTNDIAGNTGRVTVPQIADNLASMVELARAHHIRVVLCALVPANRYPWAPEQRPAPQILALNQWIRSYAAKEGLLLVDFHTPLADAEQGLGPAHAEDGVHPNDAGYAVMQHVLEPVLARALR